MFARSVRRLASPLSVLAVVIGSSSIPLPLRAAEVTATLIPPDQRHPASEFALRNEKGGPVSLHSLIGKVVLVNFWATECGGCIQELPHFIEFDRLYRSKGLQVIGVSMDVMYDELKKTADGWIKVKPFVRQKGIRYPILMDDGSAEKGYGIANLPATWLIDRMGRVAAVYKGVVSKGDVEDKINKLLSER